MKIVGNLRPNFSLSEGHVLVRAEESHELWGSYNSDFTGFVNIEMSPSLGEVGGEVSISGGTGESFMSGEDFGGGGLGLSIGHGEDTIAGSVLVLSFGGVGADHGSDEEIIGIGGESFWDDSGIS